MKTSAGEAPPGKGRGEGWDETVLVWNATVARIPAAAVQPDSTLGSPQAETNSPCKSKEADARTRPGDAFTTS